MNKKRISFAAIIIIVLLGNICIFAACNINSKITVTFNTQSYSIEAPASIVVKIGDTFGALPEPTKPNYYFGGWWINGEEIKSNTIVKRDYLRKNEDYITLYARWLSLGEKLWKDSVQDVNCFEIAYANPDDGSGTVFFENGKIRDFYFEIYSLEIWQLDDDGYILDNIRKETSYYKGDFSAKILVDYIYSELKRAIENINQWNITIDENDYTIRNDKMFSTLILTINDGKIDSLKFQAQELLPPLFPYPPDITILPYEITVYIHRTGCNCKNIPPLPELPPLF